MPGCCPRLPQLNPDGTTRDFVDYDANTIAVAYGVATGARAAAVRGRPPAARAAAAAASTAVAAAATAAAVLQLVWRVPAQVLKRIDSGRCAHAKATFVRWVARARGGVSGVVPARARSPLLPPTQRTFNSHTCNAHTVRQCHGSPLR
jgi:hypothetical protein